MSKKDSTPRPKMTAEEHDAMVRKIIGRDLTPEERKQIRHNAGVASGVARRKKRAMKDAMKMVLELQCPKGQVSEALQNAGVDDTVMMNALAMAMAMKGLAGDVEAVKLIRDTIGEKPAESLNVMNGDVRSMEMSKLTDEQLAELADREDDEPRYLPEAVTDEYDG